MSSGRVLSHESHSALPALKGAIDVAGMQRAQRWGTSLAELPLLAKHIDWSRASTNTIAASSIIASTLKP